MPKFRVSYVAKMAIVRDLEGISFEESRWASSCLLVKRAQKNI